MRSAGVSPGSWPRNESVGFSPLSGSTSQAPTQTLAHSVSGSRPFSIFTGHAASAVAPTSLGLLVCKMGPVIPPGQVQGLR